MQRTVIVGVNDTLLLSKNPQRSYLLIVCTVPNVYVSFGGRPAIVGDLPLFAQGTAFELPTNTFVSVRDKDPNDAFFNEIHAIGSAAGSAVFIAEA